ncbi:type II toxin-antitoxin system RelE/ParE family toxin [Mesorhizobium sp. LHD-90]|uniref:type II toxin-antitoxin system RelE/ParE family toxin n=1 Tax=Mesorhizobium sp. LHD-90 TaxID=3071414 RepID=UPI0027E10A78|nr:type II toxin-antitoxin system RelE/ParE family toxin [Mesorhizobium sp. LHD-90]MDQ6435036.1 type II toxin-antitoxin system RelE/ParE family toxin [Mesorhizobium sp. LHD-90]
MKTRLAPAAVQDIVDILGFLSTRSASASTGFRDRFREARQFIGQYPLSGRQTDESNVRYVNTGKHPYLIFYEIFDAEVVIMRIIHGARNPQTMPARPS